MSSLNSFTILNRDNNFFDVEVKIVHPDEHNINDSCNFALQIILELYEKIINGYIYNSRSTFFPFSQEEALSLIDLKQRPEFESILQMMRGRKIELTKEAYQQISESGNFVYNGQKIYSIGFDDFYYAAFESEYDNFCIEADKRIKQVEVLSCKDFPHWFDRPEAFLEYGHLSYGFDEDIFDNYSNEPDPSYILRIHVSENNQFLLKHMIKGCKWDSAAFDFDYYTKNFKNHRSAAYHCLQYSTKTEAAADEDLKKWWSELNSEWKLVLNINLFLQQNYPYTKLHQKYEGMMTLGVFEQYHGREQLFQLSQKEPDINELRLMSQLKILYASNCNLKDLSPLSMLKGLIILELEMNPLEKIDTLEELKGLQSLTILHNEGKCPSQKVISALSNMRDLTYDPANQEELDLIGNMPRLRTLYTLMDFDPNLEHLSRLSEIEKIVGSSPVLNRNSIKIIDKLRKKGIDVQWETEQGEI